jgi:glucokinase
MTEDHGTRHLGLDLGATNLKWAVVRRDGNGTWAVVARDQVATRTMPDPDAIPGAVVEQLREIATEANATRGPIVSIGIGVPGLYDPVTGTTRFLVNLRGPWAGQPVAGPVSDALGVPAFLINDARAFGLAELRLGAGHGASSMIGITLGTGLGGVVAIDGEVLQGHDGTAGEIGHQTIEPDGPWCGCGNRGCLEAFVRADQIAAVCGTTTVEEAVTRARSGDPTAVTGLAQIARYLAIGIGNMIVVVSPDRVVIGGGISVAADLMLRTIRDELRRRVRTTSLDQVELVTAELGTWAGAIGAAIHGAETAARGQAGTTAAAGEGGQARPDSGGRDVTGSVAR